MEYKIINCAEPLLIEKALNEYGADGYGISVVFEPDAFGNRMIMMERED